MFGDKSRPTKKVALKIFNNTKMTEGALVSEHKLKMITAFEESIFLGAIIDKRLK